MLIHNADITGSLLVNGTGFNTGSFSGSFTGIVAGTTATASYVEYNSVANKPALVSGSSQITYSGLTGIPSGIVSGSSQVTYSGLTGIPSGIVSGSAQVASFGIFATTGSNGFNGSQSITGSLTVTGQVVAQTLNVQQVTSSIVYSSGSNIFGNSLANTQQFTGSVGVTGSLTVAGAGTFTGALNGTSASFTGVVSTLSSTTNGFLAQTNANSVHPYFRWVANNRSYWAAAIDSGTDATFKIGGGNTIGSSPFFTIDSLTNASTFTTTLAVTGAATFSSTINAGNSANTSTADSLVLHGKGVTSGGIPYGDYGSIVLSADSSYTSGARRFLITNGYNATRFAIIQSVDSNTTPTLGAGGAVTSGNLIFSVSNAGTAEFSVPLIGTSATFIGDVIINSLNPIAYCNATSNNRASGIVTQESGTSKWAFGTNFGTSDNSWNVYNYAAGSRYLTIASTGAATFSSTVETTGIKFPATQVASADANTLDDYEEGTWTPTVRGSGTAGTYTLSSTNAYYTKIGNQITIYASFGFSVASGGSGYMQIKGLPFFYKANTVALGMIKAVNFAFNASTVYVALEPVTGGSDDTIFMSEIFNNAGTIDAPISSVTTSTAIRITYTYTVS